MHNLLSNGKTVHKYYKGIFLHVDIPDRSSDCCVHTNQPAWNETCYNCLYLHILIFLYHIHYFQNLNFHILPQFTFSFLNFVHKHVIVNRKLKKTFIYKHQKYEYHLILLYIFFYSFLKAFLYVSITIQNLIELAKLCTCV